MNIDTVKPMPQTIQILANDDHEAPEGNDTIRRRMASQEKLKTPANLPTMRPNITAKLTPENTSSNPTPERMIPALAKAKRGTTI